MAFTRSLKTPLRSLLLLALSLSAILSASPSALAIEMPQWISNLSGSFQKKLSADDLRQCFEDLRQLTSAMSQSQQELNDCMSGPMTIGSVRKCNGDWGPMPWPECNTHQLESCEINAKIESHLNECHQKALDLKEIETELSEQNDEDFNLLNSIDKIDHYYAQYKKMQSIVENPGEYLLASTGTDKLITTWTNLTSDSSPEKETTPNDKTEALPTQVGESKALRPKTSPSGAKTEPHQHVKAVPVEPEENHYSVSAVTGLRPTTAPDAPEFEDFTDFLSEKTARWQKQAGLELNYYLVVLKELVWQGQDQLDRSTAKLISHLPKKYRQQARSTLIDESAVQCRQTCAANALKVQRICSRKSPANDLCGNVRIYDRMACTDRCRQFSNFN